MAKRGYSSRFRSTHINPQAMTASTPALGSRTLARRKPTLPNPLAGKLLATGSEDCSIKLWDIFTHQQLLTLDGHTTAVVGLFFRPDNQQLVSVGRVDGGHCEIHFWETARD